MSNEITVTMPIREYEKMKEEIKYLKSQSVNNFIKIECEDITENRFSRTVDWEAMALKGVRS